MLRPIEHYVALAGAMLFVVIQHKEKPALARVGIAGASGGMGFSVAPELASNVSFLGPTSAMILVVAFIYTVLDAVGAIIADRDTVKSIVKARFGGGK